MKISAYLLTEIAEQTAGDNAKTDQYAYDDLSKKSGVLFIGLLRTSRSLAGGLYKPDISTPLKAPVSANLISILNNQYLKNSLICLSEVIAYLFLN